MVASEVSLSDADGVDADHNHILKLLKSTKDGWTLFDNLRGRMYYQTEKKEEVQEEIKTKKIIRKKPGSALFDYEEKV